MTRVGGVVTAALIVGLGVASADPNLDMAAREQKECDAGNAKTCATLAVRYAVEDGVKKNLPRAKQLGLQACKGKAARGCYVAGTVIYETEPKDVVRGLELLEQGCTLGSGEACNDLGAIWAEGKRGTTGVDLAKSSAFYLRACKLGNGPGCFNSGNVYRLGEGAKIDLVKALEYFEQACEHRDANGCHAAGNAYGLGEGTAKDTAKMGERYRLACRYGDQAVCKGLREAR